MPRIVHVVVTDAFAGVERYVATTARELAVRGWEVLVIGGQGDAMKSVAGKNVEWEPGRSIAEAVRSLRRNGRVDICHVHMTLGEVAGVVSRPSHRAHVVSTRHFAAHRGSMHVVRRVAPLLARGLASQIAVSQHVARNLEQPPDAIIQSGVPLDVVRWRPENRIVLVLQRLEPEKSTLVALRAWQESRLSQDGWTLRVVGEGSERPLLERWVRAHHVQGVVFAGWCREADQELAGAGMLLAPSSADSLGLSVLEAMAAGVPVVACGSGGHLETIGRLPKAPMFARGDDEGAATAMRRLADNRAERVALSRDGRGLVESAFSVSAHVDRLLDHYRTIRHPGPAPRSGDVDASKRFTPSVERSASRVRLPRELVVCSLEAWDEIWRRNQFLVDLLLRRNDELRVLFVEPPADPTFDIASGRLPSPPLLRAAGYEGRLRLLRPLKPLPRRLGPLTDKALRGQVRVAARALRFWRPTLWINDVTYAPLIQSSKWPSVYDVTDDWLAAPFSHRELKRLTALDKLATTQADAVTVCSIALAASRGKTRPVVLVPNAVDLEHFRRSRERPADLRAGPIAVYIGTLHESRLDVELVVEIAQAFPWLGIVLIGPNSLDDSARERLLAEANIVITGPRPYEDVPAYLQHADIVVVPHLVNDFTDSLDPIKAYECLAVGVPTVATPVAGFRELNGSVRVATREQFVDAVSDALRAPAAPRAVSTATWQARVAEFERVLSDIVD
jgi:glycosyltransferase involved in cell wall biosynthesis